MLPPVSIPVFFDTVFYLLVPLARSMHERTSRHYLRYLMAIAGGAAATHTLVRRLPAHSPSRARLARRASSASL